MQLVLSLFPGIGLLDQGFEEEGFCVVKGPDVLWGGDVKGFHPPRGRFNGVIGGPPCKAHSRLRFIAQHNGHQLAENLIPEFERCVKEAAVRWFLMENTPGAPVAKVQGYAVHSFLLNNRWLGEEQNRLRRFSFGVRGREAIDLRQWIEYQALEAFNYEYAVTAKGYRPIKIRIGGSGKIRTSLPNTGKRRSLKECMRLQGLPENFLNDSPFTDKAKRALIGNGVPRAMDIALARAVSQALPLIA